MSLGQDPLLLGLTKNGGAVAEWSKALQLKEKINDNQQVSTNTGPRSGDFRNK